MQTVSNKFGSASYAHQITGLERGEEDVWQGVFFGRSSSPDFAHDEGAPICSRPGHHVLLAAKTGAGKGARVILPTMLRYGLGDHVMGKPNLGASVFCIDPKGEIAAISARVRSQSQHVHIMNPWGELGDLYSRLGFPPATYNPLDVLDRRDPNVVALAQSMGAAISPVGEAKETFWASSAANLIAAVLLWLTDQPGEEKTLARLSDILNRSRKSFTTEFVARMAASKAFSGAMRRLSAPFIDMPDVTYGGIMGHVTQATAFLTDPQILAATATSSFSMGDLTGAGKDRPTTLYLVVPWDKMDIQKTWLRLMISIGMHTFKRKPPGARYRCLFLIDEFPALGLLPDMPRDIATMRGAGVDFLLAVQSLSKVKDVYGTAADDIIGNCGYKWFCQVNDLQSAEYLSKTLGKTTIQVVTKGENKGTSKSSGGSGGSASSSEGENVSYSETGRDLLTPDEVMNLGPGNAILLTPRSRPHYLWPVDYWQLPRAFAHLRATCPKLYWPLDFDLNPYIETWKQARPEMTVPSTIAPPVSSSTASKYNPQTYAPKTEIPPAAGERTKPSGTPNYNPQTYSPAGPAPEEPPKRKPYDYGLYSPKDPPKD